MDGTHIVTCGDDNKAIVWNFITKKCSSVIQISQDNKKPKMGGASSMSRKPASQQARSVVWLNEAVIVASNDGTVSVGVTDDTTVKGEWYH